MEFRCVIFRAKSPCESEITEKSEREERGGERRRRVPPWRRERTRRAGVRESERRRPGWRAGAEQQTTLFLASAGVTVYGISALEARHPWLHCPVRRPTLVESDKGGIARPVKLLGEVSRSAAVFWSW